MGWRVLLLVLVQLLSLTLLLLLLLLVLPLQVLLLLLLRLLLSCQLPSKNRCNGFLSTGMISVVSAVATEIQEAEQGSVSRPNSSGASCHDTKLWTHTTCS